MAANKGHTQAARAQTLPTSPCHPPNDLHQTIYPGQLVNLGALLLSWVYTFDFMAREVDSLKEQLGLGAEEGDKEPGANGTGNAPGAAGEASQSRGQPQGEAAGVGGAAGVPFDVEAAAANRGGDGPGMFPDLGSVGVMFTDVSGESPRTEALQLLQGCFFGGSGL